MAEFDYPFLEKREQYKEAGDHYPTAPDIQRWIERELYKRILILKEHYSDELLIFKTLRTFHKRPIFVIGFQKETEKFILEAWHFAMKPADEYRSYQLEWVLDSVPKVIFKEKLT